MVLPPSSRFRFWLRLSVSVMVFVAPILFAVSSAFQRDFYAPDMVLMETTTSGINMLMAAIAAVLVLPNLEVLLANNALSSLAPRVRVFSIFRRATVRGAVLLFLLYFSSTLIAGLLGYYLQFWRGLSPIPGNSIGWGSDNSTNILAIISIENIPLLVFILACWFGVQAAYFGVLVMGIRLLEGRRWVAYIVPTIAIIALTIITITVGLSDFTIQKALIPLVALPLEPWQYLVMFGFEVLVAVAVWAAVRNKYPVVRGAV